jgi:hypothetical protein
MAKKTAIEKLYGKKEVSFIPVTSHHQKKSKQWYQK